MTSKNIRTGLNPLMMITFIIVGLTGILMLLHLDLRGIKHVHEWMSVVFLILCIVHLFLNWRAFLAHLKNGPVLLSVIGICLLSALLFFSAGDKGKDGHYGRSGAGHSRSLNYR